MSAYVVDKSTIDKLMTFALWNAWGSEPLRAWPQMQDREQQQQFWTRVWNLNREAIRQRYPDCIDSGQVPGPVDEDGKDKEYEYEAVASPTIHQAYQALRCLIYQCSEGNIPQMALYSQLQRMSDEMAHRITSRLPQVEAAEWG